MPKLETSVPTNLADTYLTTHVTRKPLWNTEIKVDFDFDFFEFGALTTFLKY